MKRVLFVLTSHEKLGTTDGKTGFWAEEFASPYYHLADNGVEIVLASPKGGQPPIDPSSTEPDYQTPATIRFDKDESLQQAMANTLPLETINHEDFDAVFYPGGHGPMWDLAENKVSISLIEDFYNHNKPIGAVCHSPIIFRGTHDSDGEPLVKGKEVTSFTNTEERAIALDTVVPYLVEDELKNKGAIYSRKSDWEAHAVQDGLLITGQNPASSPLVAELLLKHLSN